MHTGPVEKIIFVHGYSCTNLDSFNLLPTLLSQEFATSDLYLAGWISLDDRISCTDLAVSLEERIVSLEAAGFDLGSAMIVTHSTGDIVARRWILDRRARRKGNPALGIAADPNVKTLSHFFSCAGTVHGSTMTQLGSTELAYLYRNIAEGQSVGKRVLEDLDYGSAFLRKLNRDWMKAWNDPADPLFAETFCFSMVRTDHSFWQNHLAWQSREPGSDGTVRISGANLNYSWITVNPPKYDNFTTETLNQPSPHLVVQTPTNKYSHTSQDTPDTEKLVVNTAGAISHFGQPAEPVSEQTFGIVGGVTSANERPFTALQEAISVEDLASYEALTTKWAQETTQWSTQNPGEVNSTVVVAVLDVQNTPVDDSLVAIRDVNGIGTVAACLVGNPIANAVSPSIKTFYMNTAGFRAVHGHQIHVAALADTQFVTYGNPVDATLSNTDPQDQRHVVEDNQCTYVDVVVERDPAEAFAFYTLSNPDLASFLTVNFPPFSPKGRL